MVKNKKGKKKNKMAGRSRPGAEEAPESANTNAPVVLDDTSETEDRSDSATTTIAVSPEPEALTSDSGIDSGRGSPGEPPGPSTLRAITKIGIQPQISEEKISEDAEEEPTPEVNSNNAEQIIARTSPKTEARAQSPVKPDEKMPEKSQEAVKLKSDDKRIERTADKRTENAKTFDPKPDPKPEKAGKSPPVDARPRGASSLKRRKPAEQIKHPLEFPWSFWTFDPSQKWEDALDQVASFDTVEDFWYLFRTVRNPRALGKAVSMFKKDVKPEWEHPRNAHGGRWNLSLGYFDPVAEDLWRELTLLLIGGIKFKDLTPHLCGIYCSWKLDRIHYSVWIDTLDERIARPMGNIIHETLFSVLERSFPMDLVPTNTGNGRKKVIAAIK